MQAMDIMKIASRTDRSISPRIAFNLILGKFSLDILYGESSNPPQYFNSVQSGLEKTGHAPDQIGNYDIKS
jgi:hypothetical protein